MLDQLDNIIQTGQRLMGRNPPPANSFYRWRRDAQALLNAVGSKRLQDFSGRCSRPESIQVADGIAILQSAKEDAEGRMASWSGTQEQL